MKLLFYLIILAVWIISALKKQGHWEEKIPDFPEDSSPLPSRNPQAERTDEEGYFPGAPGTPPLKKPALSYEKKLELRRKKLLALKNGINEPKVITTEIIRQPSAAPDAPARDYFEEKPPSSLQSSIKEGIIWSIILGPPRSKLRFDGKNPPLQR
ncbi:MAG: hypothetical protein PHO30_01860 [Candidatus Omnitrophica bacterium]|nr:hypothetical protein [Candidatus Omnitrophota bacterium]